MARLRGSLIVRYGFWLIAALVVGLDQGAKAWVLARLPLRGPSVILIPGALSLTHVRNTGVAFGQLHGAGPVLILLAAAAVAGILVYRARRLRSAAGLHPLLALGLALPLGGALGNVIDRVRFGEVVDFIDFGWFPVFNVADSAITVGAVALVWYFLFVSRPEAAADGGIPSAASFHE
jgi:signal peptidase II